MKIGGLANTGSRPGKARPYQKWQNKTGEPTGGLKSHEILENVSLAVFFRNLRLMFAWQQTASVNEKNIEMPKGYVVKSNGDFMSSGNH